MAVSPVDDSIGDMPSDGPQFYNQELNDSQPQGSYSAEPEQYDAGEIPPDGGCDYEINGEPEAEHARSHGQHGASSGRFGASSGQFGASSGQFGASSGQFGASSGQHGSPSGQSGRAHASHRSHGRTGTRHVGPMGVGEIPLPGCGDVEVEPMPPPLNQMARIPGYDAILSPNVTLEPPPSYQQATTGRPIVDVVVSAKLTEDEARAMMVALAKSKCCWGTGAAKDMRFKSIEFSTVWHYVLKTFLETRSTNWASEPFKGQMVDGPQYGVPPPPWSIQMSTPPMFHDTVLACEVPHTASVRVCHGCGGSTSVICNSCRGLGRKQCTWCYGSGKYGSGEERKACPSCGGSGYRMCEGCNGRGRVQCPTCRGAGQVKCFVKLTVAYKTKVRDFILERNHLPHQLIRDAPGATVYEDTQPLLNPIQGFSEPQVNIQSAQIIGEHRAFVQTGRIWMQNHVIRGVPVFQCDCQWKDKDFQFFVYGDNWMVYSDNYPQTCCCGCQLL